MENKLGRLSGGLRGAITGVLIGGGVAGAVIFTGDYIVPAILSSPVYEAALAVGSIAAGVGFIKTGKAE